MLNKSETLQDAIFLITQEKSCSIYNVGEELRVTNKGLTATSYKPACLHLSQAVLEILTNKSSFSSFSKVPSAAKKARFDCGGCEGCEGLIHFEYKKDRDYATLQMKLLNDAEERRRKQHLDKFFGVLRKIRLFESLDDASLADLTLLLDLKTIPVDKVLIKKGDPPTNLFILLKGRAAVLDNDGSKIGELKDGDIFGELSLLSGEPTTNSVHTEDKTHVATLSMKNFRHAIVKYPIIQLFLFRMLVDRAQKVALQAGDISSGMTGNLEDVSAVDLFQLINSSQKSGTIELVTGKGKAVIIFKDGQIIFARFLEFRDREAVFALLSVENGEFKYTKSIPVKIEQRSPIGDFMGMLMEGVQRLDEKFQ